jgi:hypothetical protein
MPDIGHEEHGFETDEENHLSYYFTGVIWK